MIAFLDHVQRCEVCRWPRKPCLIGYNLFESGAEMLLRRYDPKRAKA